MKEIPILFSTPMVQAILEGRKSQTRRLLKCKRLPAEDIASVHPDGSGKGWIAWAGRAVSAEETRTIYPGEQGFKCPYGNPGDLLWVRETWGVGSRPDPFEGSVEGIEFKADLKFIDDVEPLPLHQFEDFDYGNYDKSGWRPSIHMPKNIARIWLQVTDVRVERLQDISTADIEKEGISFDQLKGCDPCIPASVHFHQEWKNLWVKINGPESWQANPFVWCISFEILSTTGKPK